MQEQQIARHEKTGLTMPRQKFMASKAWRGPYFRSLYFAASFNDAANISSQNCWAAAAATAAAGRACIDMHGLLPPAVASWLTLSDL